MRRASMMAFLASLTAFGCVDLFDPALYLGEEAGLSGELVDVCGVEAPMLRVGAGAGSFTFPVDTRSFSDQNGSLSVSCTGRAQNGPDVFMQIEAAQGDHWHFHMDIDPVLETRAIANPAIYVLPEGCDDRMCQFGDGLDLCGVSSDEHFTFVPEAAGSYVIAFDSPLEGYGGEVLAIRTECGDGSRDHSENCDDGNLVDGDGCDSLCRSEITGASPTEVEVNDDVYAANRVMAAGAEPVRVRAELSSLCESDVFAVDVPEGGDVIVSLTGSGGGACPADLITSELALMRVGNRGPDRLAVGQIEEGQDCPSLRAGAAGASDLSAGTYFISVQALRDRADVVAYEVNVTVAP